MSYISKSDWELVGEQNGWKMPAVPWWKRLPIIRHVRVIWGMWHVEKHYEMFCVGARTGYDEWVLDGMWEGEG